MVEIEKELPKELKKAAEEKKLIIFLGAGCSSDFGCYSWNRLASSLLDKCFKKNKISFLEKNHLEEERDSKKIVTICKNLLEEEDFKEEMNKALNSEKVGKEKNDKGSNYEKNIKMHRELLDIGGIFVTTNADMHIDEFFLKGKIKYEDFNDTLELERDSLYKIHGSIEKIESLVFTTTQYLKRYNDEDFIGFIKKIFIENTVLFIGYSLQELELLDHLITKIGGKSKGKNYLINGYFNYQEGQIKVESNYYNDLGIEILPFSKDKNGFEGLKDLISRYANEMKNTVIGIKKLIEIDEIMEDPYE